MELLTTLAIIYLILGLAVSLFLFFDGKSTLFEIPLNTLGGPIPVIIAFIRFIKKSKGIK